MVGRKSVVGTVVNEGTRQASVVVLVKAGRPNQVSSLRNVMCKVERSSRSVAA